MLYNDNKIVLFYNGTLSVCMILLLHYNTIIKVYYFITNTDLTLKNIGVVECISASPKILAGAILGSGTKNVRKQKK